MVMHRKKIIYIAFIIFTHAACTGPEKTTATSPSSTTSPAVTKKTSVKKMVNGYQLQVLNTNNRTEAINAKSLLLSKYPQQKTILLFENPYYKIRFGNFLNKADAVAYQKKIKAYFENVFLIPIKFEIKVEE